MTTLFVDIETRSSTELRGTGVYRYSEDPTFQILMCAWSLDGSPVEVAIGEDEIAEIPGLDDPAVTHVAHNANFERVCLAVLAGMPTDPDNWRCTMAVGAQLGYPQKLDHLARALGGEQKDSAGTLLINWFCKPDRQGRFRRPQDHQTKWNAFVEYCRQDVVTLIDVDAKMGSAWPSERERQVWITDQRVNDRGLKVDVDLARRAAREADRNRVVAEREVRSITGLPTPGNVVQLAKWCGIPDLREATVTETLTDPWLNPERRRVLELRQELAGSATKKYHAALAAVSDDGRLRGGFRYHGAHTGRWTGHGVQPHNLPRASLESDTHVAAALLDLEIGLGAEPDTLKALVRSLFLGPLCVVDYAAIEARVIAWLADEQWALDAFRSGRDIYVETAERMGGLTRFQGKVAVLALGYAGGVNSLRVMGAEGTDEQLQAMVHQWRYANPRVVRLWRRMENSFRLGGPVGRLIRVERRGTDRVVHLPSGRTISYHGCRFGDRITFDSVKFPGHRDDTYGGRLIENVTQAVARDVLADALVRLDEQGYRVVGHVHDEVIVEAEAAELDVIEKIVTTPPDWAAGLPIDGSGFACARYKKS